MADIRKFLFETDFEAPPPPPPAPEVMVEEDLPPPPPTFSEAELALARKSGYSEGLAEGVRQGRVEALSGQGHLLNQMLDRLDGQVAQLLKTQSDTRAEAEDRTVQIALTIARKLLPSFAATQGLGEIEAMVHACMNDLSAEPRLVIRTHDSLLDGLTAKVQGMAALQGFQGQLVFLADAALGPGDVRIEWADGGAERSDTRVWAEVDRVVANAMKGPERPAEVLPPSNPTVIES